MARFFACAIGALLLFVVTVAAAQDSCPAGQMKKYMCDAARHEEGTDPATVAAKCWGGVQTYPDGIQTKEFRSCTPAGRCEVWQVFRPTSGSGGVGETFGGYVYLAVDGCMEPAQVCGATGSVASSGYYDVGTTAGADPVLLGCKGECKVFFDGTSPAGSAVINGEKHWYAKGSYHFAGVDKKCNLAEQQTKQLGQSTPTKPADGCAPGQGEAKMNGKTRCYDQAGRQTDESTDKARKTTELINGPPNADGSTSTMERTVETDVSGNKKTTITVTRRQPNGNVESTTTVEGGLSGDSNVKDDNPDSEKGECEKNPSGEGCGGDPAALTDLYAKKDKTLDGVLSGARDAFLASPVGSAVGGFFVVSGNGSCPTWQADIAYFKTTIVIDQFCTPWASAALTVLKVALVVVASFFAFRVAVE